MTPKAFVMGKPMFRVGLLAWATSCGGLGCAVTADKREVPDVDQHVEKSIILLSRVRVYYHNEDMGWVKIGQKPPTNQAQKMDRNKTDVKGVPHRNYPRTKHTVEGMVPERGSWHSDNTPPSNRKHSFPNTTYPISHAWVMNLVSVDYKTIRLIGQAASTGYFIPPACMSALIAVPLHLMHLSLKKNMVPLFLLAHIWHPPDMDHQSQIQNPNK